MGGRGVLRHEAGSVTIEFFLIVPLIIAVLGVGLLVVSAARARIELLGAVREGARVAATTPDPSQAVEAVRHALSPTMRDLTRVSVSRPSVVGRPARVMARFRHRVDVPLLRVFSFDLSASASMLVER